jgi:hypothetical protein
MRTCISCWKDKSTKLAIQAIETATADLSSLQDAHRLSTERGFKDASSKVSLIVPGDNHRTMQFKKLSEYAERLLMNQIYEKFWEPTVRMLVNLDTIPDACSFQGRVFKDVGHLHVLSMSPETELEPLFGAPPRKLGVLGPLRRISLSDAMKKKPGDEGNEKWVAVGYYPAAEATIDAMAIVKESDSISDYLRAILLQYTVSKAHTKKAIGLLKVRTTFEDLGLDELVPFEKSESHSDGRHDWVFIWVVPKRAAEKFRGKKFSETDKYKWLDNHIAQYKLVVDLEELTKKKPSRLYLHSTYPR